MNPTSNNKIITKKSVLIFGSVLAVSAALTVGILLLLNVRTQTNNNPLKSVALSPQQIIDKFKETNAPSSNQYVINKNRVVYDSINYLAEDKYKILIKPDIGIQYDRLDKSISRNSAELIAGADSFLTNLNMRKSQTYTPEDGSSLYVYDSLDIVCQVSDVPAIQQSPSSFILDCVSHSVINDKYTKFDRLLDLYRSSGGSSQGFVSIMQNDVIVEGTKSLLTLLVTREGQAVGESTSLIFAATNSNWEYIGERPTPSVDIESSFIMPDKLKSAIESSKYKDLLNKYIR